MRRYPEIAHKAALEPEIAKLRFEAINKLQAAHLAVGMLKKYVEEDPVKELEREENAIALMEDATHFFRVYLRAKLKRYQELLQDVAETQQGLIKEGNRLATQHADALRTFLNDHKGDDNDNSQYP